MAEVAGADRCPRCGQAFNCGVAGARPCACTTLTLSPALQAHLRATWTGCLCLDCLTQLARADAGAEVPPQR